MIALLIGDAPPLEHQYVSQKPYEGVVIGSLTLGQLLHFRHEAVLAALAEGLPVVLYTPGLPTADKNRSLAAAVASAKRELKSWGVVFCEGQTRRVITAQQAKLLRQQGQQPAPGAVLTPLAREIMEGTQ